jgi:hypothetical protein
MPSFRMRGISFDCIPSLERIASALMPSLRVFTRRTIFPAALYLAIDLAGLDHRTSMLDVWTPGYPSG